MEAISRFLTDHNVYFNYFSFANLLGFVFTFFLGLFLVTLPNRSKSTNHLGISFLFLAPFYLAYVFAHAYYGPAAAYHRWVTVGVILIPFIHFVQWALKYPRNDYPVAGWLFAVMQYLILLASLVLFIGITNSSGVKFLFTAHHWDFDADFFSERYGAVILLYIVIFLAVGVFRTISVKTKERWTILAIVIAIMIAAILPAPLNIMSRGGYVPRGFFVTVFVIMTVLGYFLVTVIYINRTEDRTTFMVKIVGISLVTFLLMMQAISLVSLEDREDEYDALHVEYTQRVLEGGSRNPDIQYIIRYDLQTGQAEQRFPAAPMPVSFEENKEDLANTAVYEDLKRLPEVGFGEQVQSYFAENSTHPFFAGYRTAILNFIESSEAEDDALADATEAFFKDVNITTRVNRIKINKLPDDGFRAHLNRHLTEAEAEFAPFAAEIDRFQKNREELKDAALKREVVRFLAPLKPEYARHFRKADIENYEEFRHFTAFTQYDRKQNAVYEVGYSYINYRKYIHESAFTQKIILLGVLFVLLVIFPLFFRGSLINPLNNLLSGVKQVNDGDLSVQVPIKVQDEIGFLAGSFNSMVVSIRDAREKLQDYANNLEEKVKERTAELNQTLEEVRALKTQQDGDYYLTSLLQKPLNYDANKSDRITTDFYIKQKKRFEFRSKPGDLGGDICVTGNLRLGTPDNYRRYVVAVNGDAMGKSMQGAGGSLVMGVVMNSILARSAKGDRILDSTPQQWLTDVYDEVHGVFTAFNGSMVISAVIAVVDEESGEMWYFNAEHPYSVIYRNGKASFVEEELQLRKLGLESEIPFAVHYFKLEPGDILYMGSDGRDDLDLTPDQPVRTINEDEFLFLKRVEEADGDIDLLVEGLSSHGGFTDDLSLLRIAFTNVPARSLDDDIPDVTEEGADNEVRPPVIDIDVLDEEERAFEASISGRDASGDDEAFSGLGAEFDALLSEGRALARDGKHAEALNVLDRAYAMRQDVPALNKILAVLTFKERDYEKAIEILDQYLEHDPGIVDFWLYLSISLKRTGELQRALRAGEKVHSLDSERVVNLINLADIHQKLGNGERAREFLDRALELDPQNRQARTLSSAIS